MSDDEALADRVESLENRMGRVEDAVGLSEPVKTEKDTAVEEDSPRETPEQPDKQEPESTHEENTGTSWSVGGVMAWTGSIILGVGLLFLISYAIDQGWIPLTAQVALGVIGGLLIAGTGTWLRSYQALQGALLSAVGMAASYFSVYTAYTFPAYREATGLSFTATSVLLVALVIATMVLSVWQRSGVLLVEASILVSLTTVINDFTAWLTWSSATYTLVLLGGSAVLAHRRSWNQVMTAIGFVHAAFTAYVVRAVMDGTAQLAGTSSAFTTFLFAAGFSAVYYVLSMRREADKGVVITTILSYVFAFSMLLRYDLTWLFYVYTALTTLASAGYAHRTVSLPTLSVSGIGSAASMTAASYVVSSGMGLNGTSPVLSGALFIGTFLACFLPLSLIHRYASGGLLVVLASYASTLLVVSDYGVATVCYAAVCLALYAFQANRESQALPYLAGGIALIAVYVPVQFEQAVLRPVWAVLLAATGYLDAKQGKQTTISAVTWLLGISLFLLTLGGDLIGTEALLGSIFVFLSYAFVCLALASAERFEAHPFYLATVFVALIGVSRYLSDTLFTVGTGIVGILSLVVGSSTNRSLPRFTGLIIIALSVVKLLAIDTLSATPVIRIVSYITLGVIVLGASVFLSREE